MFGFMKAYAKTKAEDAGVGVMGALASWDPKGASEADIRVMESNLDALVKKATEAKIEADREQREYEEIQTLYNRRLGGIENLEQRKSDMTDEAAISEIDAVIMEEMEKLEQMLPDIEREKQEAEEAASFKAELDELCKMSADKLKSARSELNSAMWELKRAKVKAQRAEEKAKTTAQVEGITRDMSKMTSALGALKSKAASYEAEAEAANMKSSLLKSSSPKTNSIMEEAMAAAEGTPAKATSMQDRLAALKAKKA